MHSVIVFCLLSRCLTRRVHLHPICGVSVCVRLSRIGIGVGIGVGVGVGFGIGVGIGIIVFRVLDKLSRLAALSSAGASCLTFVLVQT